MGHLETLLGATEEAAQGEIEAAFGELLEDGCGGWILEHLGLTRGDVEEDLAGLVDVRSVGDADGEDETGDGAGKGPVHDRTGHEFFVRYDEFFLVPVRDRGGPDPDLCDDTIDASDGDDVADADGAFEEEDEPAHEVRDNLLKPKAEADRKGGGDPAEARPIESDRLKGNGRAHGDNDILAQRDHRISHPTFEFEGAEKSEFEETGEVLENYSGNDSDDPEPDQVADADAGKEVAAIEVFY